VFSVPTDVPAAERARWLAEVSAALDAARDLIVQLEFAADEASAPDLHLRIETARMEVRSLRLSRSLQSRPQLGPERIDLGLWYNDETAT
jgi:hypothetical protein